MNSALNAQPDPQYRQIVVMVSANAEWRAVRGRFPAEAYTPSPYGEWFQIAVTVNGHQQPVIFFHGGWGKIAAAASTQYAIDRWSPALLINLGTCGGFEGASEAGTIVLVEKTLVYDILEQMGDSAEAIEHYTTALDLSWLSEPYPTPVHRTLLVSGDRDLVREEISGLKTKYSAVAGDWESGAIAYVATRNKTRLLILRGISDVVGSVNAEAYGNPSLFAERTAAIMNRLIDALPLWIATSHE